jgi:microsomal dipeptidase-like Zn-dependent dipeptidase
MANVRPLGAELERDGYSTGRIRKFLGGNLLRGFRQLTESIIL